jgi:cholesterol oxidase
MYWLSESFYTLFSEGEPLPQGVVPSARMTADVVVVGSGYGGAIAAQKIAQALVSTKASVLLLERGKEYVPGEFPEDVDELPAHVHIRNPRGSKGLGYSTSLYQIYPADTAGSGQVSVIVGNALGGGSQINANVAKEPHASVFAHAAWPHPLRDAGLDVLRPHFEAVRKVLGARPIPVAQEPSKHAALRRLHAQFSQPGRLPAGYRAEFESPDLAVSFKSGESVAGIPQSACIGCGNCCSGCNTGAKNTLTMNYLPLAKQAGARIITQAQVQNIRMLADSDGYELEVHPAQALEAPDEDRRLLIRARVVVLAAGALGSTEVLLRSSQLREYLSDRLGERFSTNGDSICARYDTDRPVHAMGLGLRAELAPANERPGPTISGAIRIVPESFQVGQTAKALPSFTIEDCAIPLALAGLGAELLGTTAALRAMQSSFFQDKRRPGEDPLGSSAAAALNSEVYLTMAHDSASGTIVVDTQGALRVAWPDNSIPGREPAQNDPAQSVLNALLAGSHGQGGRYIPNPVREPLPKEMTAVMSNMPQAGLVTVHPLGGCSMGDDVSAGVVDHRGRVFDKRSSGVLDGLYVLDGSIVPCSLETNPFLTISALADRAVDQLIELDLLRLCAPQVQNGPRALLDTPKIPVVARKSKINQVAATEFIFRERLRTPLTSAAELIGVFPESELQELIGARANNLFLQLDLSYSPPDLRTFLASEGS